MLALGHPIATGYLSTMNVRVSAWHVLNIEPTADALLSLPSSTVIRAICDVCILEALPRELWSRLSWYGGVDFWWLRRYAGAGLRWAENDCDI